MVADSTEVAGTRFIHARALPDDGKLEDAHLILRVDIDGDQITIRNLDEDFLKDKHIDSDDSLRKVIEVNLENNDLYDDTVFTGQRVKGND